MSDHVWLLGFGAGALVILVLAHFYLKQYFWRIATCVVPLALSGWIVGEAWSNYGNPAATGFKFNLGVDLAGGTILVYESIEGQDFDSAELAAALKRRIDPTNTREITIRPIKSTPPRVEIILPMQSAKGKKEAADIAEIKDLISRVGKLEFRIIADSRDMNERKGDAEAIKVAKDAIEALGAAVDPSNLPAPENFAWVEVGDEAHDRMEDDHRTSQFPAGFSQPAGYSFPFYLVPNAPDPSDPDKVKRINRYWILTRIPQPEEQVRGEDIGNVRPSMDFGKQVVLFSVKSPGDERMSNLTSPNVKRLLCVVMDNKLTSYATINDPLRSSVQVTMGTGDAKEIQKRVTALIRVLRSGALPATLKRDPASELSMGPGLGEDTIRKGTWAVVGALIGVIAFMMIYYHFAGGVASVALFANLLLTVAFMVAVKAAFTLPGLAGLVLTLGMAVDANVLIYERIREERERGASITLAIRNGYDRAFPTIIDTHLTSIFTAIVLYAVGNDQLKGFGVSLTAGLVISLFTSLYITRLIFDLLLAKGMLPSLSMLKILTKPNFDFMKWRFHWLFGTVAVSLFGLAVFIFRGEDGLDIDFTGGTAYSVEFKQPRTINDVRNQAQTVVNPNDPNKLKDIRVEATAKKGITESSTDTYTFRTTLRKEWVQEQKQTAEVQKLISQAFDGELVMVEPKAGAIKPLTGNPRFDREIEFQFNNKNMAETDVGRVVGAWLAGQKIGRPEDFYEVKGVGAKDEQGLYGTIALRYKMPDVVELADPQAGEKLRDYVVQSLHQPKSERLENFDAQLAGEVQQKAIVAIALSWLAITMYLWFRFGNWTFGLAAVLCLVHDLAFTVGLIGISHYLVTYTPIGGWLLLEDFKIDLPAVAALLTLIGYSVNDTIVVFDRIREVRGKSPELTPKMINDSVNQTLGRSLITSFTVFLVVFILYVFGGEGIHLFSFVMVVGVIVGSYSSIFVASPLLLIFGEGRTRESVRVAPEPQEAAV
jgi:SecD/SecF fusion protein